MRLTWWVLGFVAIVAALPTETETSLLQPGGPVSPAATTAASVASPAVPSFASEVCVGIPSARRYQHDGSLSPENYLDGLMRSLYRDQDPSALMVFIWNVDREPPKNVDPQQLAEVYNGTQAIDSPLNADQVAKNLPQTVIDSFEQTEVSKDKQIWRAKEVLDGANILEKCARSGRKYTLFLEDDVVATSKIWEKLETFVHKVPSDFAFLTLYNPTGWEAEDASYQDGSLYNFFCCTQSLLFDNSKIDDIIRHIREGYTREPVDHLLAEYSRDTTGAHLTHVYVAIPSLFQHMGAYSTLAERTLDPPEVAHQSQSWEAILLQPTVPEHLKILENQPRCARNHEQHMSWTFEP